MPIKIAKKSFSSYMPRLAHEKRCVNKSAKPVSFKCQRCDKGFNSSRALVEHENRENHVISHCRKCGEKLYSFKELYIIIIERKNKRCSQLKTSSFYELI